VLHPDAQIVSILRGTADHINISQFCGNIQRFLLCQYRWAIHVDCDGFSSTSAGSAAC
jgi:hypothetical protein